MNETNAIINKKILIYGAGKSGISSFNYLKNKNICYLFDDFKTNILKKYKKNYISQQKLKKSKYDFIILSPGIDINKCLLSKFLKNNLKKILTELDIFYKFYPKITTVTVTGTNGKSTTCKLLHDILINHGIDSRLTGNIGNPLLNEKKITKNTVFVVEASSYQLAYAKNFRSKFSLILNISPDHLERHLTMKKYIQSKLKCVTNQIHHDTSIIQDNEAIKNILKVKRVNSKIIFLRKKKYIYLKKKIQNDYFKKFINFQNVEFIFELSKFFNLKTKNILNSINNFRPLNFRHELIHDSKHVKVINDSKSTSLSSTTPFLETKEKTYWILGGLSKKGDKFNLKNKYFKNLYGFIYGKDKKKFYRILKNKINIKLNNNLRDTIILISKRIKNENKKITILFSPAAASFDQFKNFEERGKYFNNLIKKYLMIK